LFPSLPVDEPMRSEEIERRRSVVDAASRVQYRPPRPPMAPRPPRPGNGVFEPSPGEPGASVTVEVRGTPLEGCILFPAPSPRTFWVSFWDGLTPVEVKIPRGSTVGQVKPSVEDELVRRLRARGSAACPRRVPVYLRGASALSPAPDGTTNPESDERRFHARPTRPTRAGHSGCTRALRPCRPTPSGQNRP